MERINPDSLSVMFSSAGDYIYRRAEKSISDYGMDEMMEQGVLLGLSGGADSVMLLCVLLEYRRRHLLEFPIVAVHVNHGIRGDEADSDEDFCRELCNGLGVELIVVKKSVPEIAEQQGLGLEEVARNVRYSIFCNIIQGRGDLSAIAVAHNMSDNAETVLFNIMRGSGARGASGIRPVRDNIIRPLIDIPKSEIVSALSACNIPFVTDSTNLSCEYSRNYIRNEVMPSLARLCGEPERMLSRFAYNMGSDDDYINSVAHDFLARHKKVRNTDLRGLHYSVFIRVLSLMAGYEAGYPSTSVSSDIYNLISKDNFVYSLYEDVKFICERGVCSVGKIADSEDYHIEVSEGVTPVIPFNADFILSKEKNDKYYLNVYKKSIQANLSSAIINGSLYLRPKKDGDTVYYGGMTHKLKKLFNDKKIPLSVRKTLPILCDDRGVVWVPGFGVRDDGLPKEERNDIYAVLAMNEDRE